MQHLFETLVGRSVAMSALIILYVAVTPLLAKRYAASWLYYAWLIIVLGLVIPFRPPLETALVRVDVPFTPPAMQTPDLGLTDQSVSEPAPDGQDSPAWPWHMPAVFLWAAGAAAVVMFHMFRHLRFTRTARRWSEDIADGDTLRIFHGIKEELGIRRPAALRICHGVSTPMLVGAIRPVVLLPPEFRTPQFSSGEIARILKHELVHLKRHDLWYRGLVLLATAVHWFNPAVYLMAKAIAGLCEISCDERVLQGASFGQRKQYCETILRGIRSGNRPLTSWSTHFTGGKRRLKIRFQSILDTTKKRPGIAVLIVVLLAVILAGMAFDHRMPTVNGETAAGANGKAPADQPVYSMAPYAPFLTKTGHETVPYEWDGRWVRSLYDEPPGQKPVLYFLQVEDADVEGWSSPVYLRAVRNPDTGEIERLEEMSGKDAFELLHGDQAIVFSMFLKK